MASTYKTPGVYVEEVSLFPPSIAQVETAVPAFIGYTETHSKFGENLLLKPTKIRSLAEYEESFGGAPETIVNSVDIDALNNVVATKLDKGFLLYDSLRLFFANGGAKCYIISVGEYPASTTGLEDAALKDGLTALEKEDEPTLILFPDAIFLDADKLISLQQSALAQAAKLGDRFCLLDTRPNEKNEEGVVTVDFEDKAQEFRNAIGVNNLKYGAAYGPYLRTNLEKNITYRDIKGKIKRLGGASVGLSGLTTESETLNALNILDNALSDVDAFDANFSDGLGKLEEDFLDLENLFNTEMASGTFTTQKTAYQNLVIGVFNILKDKVNPIALNTGSAFAAGVVDSAGQPVRYVLEDVIASVGDTAPGVLFSAASTLLSLAAHVARTGADLASVVGADLSAPGWGTFVDGDAGDFYSTSPFTTQDQKKENMKEGASRVASTFKAILAELSSLRDTALAYESTYENALLARFPLFKTIVNRTKNTVTDIPPSGAIAGVYTAVDNQRGVHKAPANVSLNSVVGVADLISHDQQQDLNVDVVAGKSINVIRPFTGKGILVWGARTLAGNDNEWRYVPVRRFFNMVEESAKKATEQFVFEPNDANTWTKVKAMIENFLINQWRSGALAGSTPEQAFFVNVGLNQTMTAQDVLEGKMIVEIGMAAVRPAEFIILRFSHKLQEA